MSAENYSADGCVEDSVLEYNGARGLIFIGGAGFVFFLILTLLMVIFRDHVRTYNLVLGGIGAAAGFIYCIWVMVHNYLEIDAKFIYTYNNGHLEISKARRNGLKKLLFSAELDSLEVMGKDTGRLLVSDIYKKTLKNTYTKMDFCGANPDGSRRDYYHYQARFNIDGKFISILFNPSEDLINVITRQYPDKVFSEEK